MLDIKLKVYNIFRDVQEFFWTPYPKPWGSTFIFSLSASLSIPAGIFAFS